MENVNRFVSLMLPKERLKKLLLNLGYEIHRIRPGGIGRDPFKDMRMLTNPKRPAILFDVGANRGQSVAQFRAQFESPIIHAFEPSPSTFKHLQERTSGIPNLYLNNVAVGPRCERKILLENEQDTVSSLLPPGNDYSWGQTSRETTVDVTTVDSYCEAAGIKLIDVLKSDTQGFDHEVLDGAVNMLRQHRIQLVYLEMNFLDLYTGIHRFEDLYRSLSNLGFEPISFYNLSWQNSRLGWLDGLFIDPLFNYS